VSDRGSRSDPGSGSSQRQYPRRHERPDHFSTYTPRELVRRLKVVAAIRDVPLWAIVTDALEQYLKRFEDTHGQLPQLTQIPEDEEPGRG